MGAAEFHRPADQKDACALVVQFGNKATVLAGGTDVMVDVNRRRISPEILIYIGDIGWSYINTDGDKLVIGATTTHTEMAKSALVLEKAPLLAAAVSQIGSPAIRNMRAWQSRQGFMFPP